MFPLLGPCRTLCCLWVHVAFYTAFAAFTSLLPEHIACEYKYSGAVGLEYVAVSVFLYTLVGAFTPVDIAPSKSELVLDLTSINILSLMYFDLLYSNALDPFPF